MCHLGRGGHNFREFIKLFIVVGKLLERAWDVAAALARVTLPQSSEESVGLKALIDIGLERESHGIRSTASGSCSASGWFLGEFSLAMVGERFLI